MAKAWRPDPDEIPTSESLTLVVGWKKGRHVEARHVSMAAAVRNSLRTACVNAVEQLGNAQAVDFGPDAIIEADEYMAVPRHVVAGDAEEILSKLDKAAGLDTLDPAKIPRLWF